MSAGVFMFGFAADSLGSITGLGVGRGSAYAVRIAGICLVVTSALILIIKSIRALEPALGSDNAQ